MKNEGLLIKITELWPNCKILDEKRATVERLTNIILKEKETYLRAQALTGCPWFVIAAIHNLEGGVSFNKQLLNGEDWRKVTTLVPKGRGPWKSWEESAVEGLRNLRNTMGLTIPALLEKCERHNGLGYYRMGRTSPYLWSMTNHYSTGKYVADGKFDPSAISRQVGAAALILMLIEKKHILPDFNKGV